MVHQEVFIGPLPPPEVIERYERLLPGAADRVLALAEREQAQRHALETEALRAQIEDQRTVHSGRTRGQWLGFAIVIAAFGLAAIVALVLRTPEALVFAGSLCGATLIGLVSIFVVGRSAKLRARTGSIDKPAR